MDFVHDALLDGRAFRVLTVVDQWSRWSPILETAQSMSGSAVAAALDKAIARHGKPKTITVDHGTEFTSRALDDWAYRRGVTLDFIRPGKPTENGFIEAFNGKLRDECLNTHQFVDRGREEQDRGVAGRLQRASTAQLAGSTDTPRVFETVRDGGRRIRDFLGSNRPNTGPRTH
jgi:transposase InsO family protein